MKRANALSKCPGCDAVANPRWPECLACGEVLPSLKELARKVLERNGSRVSTPEPANDSSDRWDEEMTELTAWFLNTDRPLIRFHIRPNMVVFDVAQYWAGLRAEVKAGPKHIPTAKLRTELRRLHDLFGPAASREAS